MAWWGYALLASFTASFYFSANARYQLAGERLVFGRSLVACLLFLPVCFIVDWPEEYSFYILGLGCGVIGTVIDISMFNSAAKFGGAVVSRVFPARIWFSFIVWSVVDPNSFWRLWDEPAKFIGVMVCLVSAGVAMMLLRKCNVNRAALIMLAPAIVLVAVTDAIFKYSVGMHGGIGGVFHFMLLLNVGMVITSGLYILVRGNFKKPTTNDLVASGVVGVLFAVMVSFVGLTLERVENPAYGVAVFMTSALWIFIYNKIKGIPDEANPLVGLAFVASAILLVLLF